MIDLGAVPGFGCRQTGRTPGGFAPSSELFEVRATAGHWQELSGGAVNPAVESLIRTWKDAAKQRLLPALGALDAGR